MGFLHVYYLGSKERHKPTTRNGVLQGVFSYLSLMLP